MVPGDSNTCLMGVLMIITNAHRMLTSSLVIRAHSNTTAVSGDTYSVFKKLGISTERLTVFRATVNAHKYIEIKFSIYLYIGILRIWIIH